MCDAMSFPATVEEFMEQYKIVDCDHVYSNGMEMVPIFRMKQWFEHEASKNADTGKMVGDCISRQAALDAIRAISDHGDSARANALGLAEHAVENLPPVQPTQTNCEYCHTDRDGYVLPLEKNCHAYISLGMNGWVIELKAKGWRGEAKIKYCPICGRRLTNG